MKPATPHALLRLGAHHPGPARVELEYRPASGRAARALLVWAICWGALPFLVWVPPHYPWVTAAFLAGIYLPFRIWTGKYVVWAFAGACPRCGRPLALGAGSKIDLPHTLTCFGCHFEPRLEVVHPNPEAPGSGVPRVRIVHREADCTGEWRPRWKEDERWVVCTLCAAAHPATQGALAAAEAENESGRLLRVLADGGRFLP